MNEHKFNAPSSWPVLLWIITVALLVFTAARSVHLIQYTLPPDAQILAYAALAGLDGGVLAWLFWTTRTAAPGTQRTIGILMIIVDLVGITAAVLGDTMLIASPNNAELVGTIAIWIVPLIIVSNIASSIVAHVADPAQTIRDANRVVQDEIDRQTADTLTQNAPMIAGKIAKARAAHTARQTAAGMLAHLDTNQDGSISLDELLNAFARRNGNPASPQRTEATPATHEVPANPPKS